MDRSDTWTLIGKRDPQKPQMFYPITDSGLTLTQGDRVAARCTMVNHRDRITAVGATNEDEMCNFYIMYWVDGPVPMDKGKCFTPVRSQIESVRQRQFCFRARLYGPGAALG